LPHYGWYADNSTDRAWPGGLMRPNDFGLFDLYGNAAEWCGSQSEAYPTAEQASINTAEPPAANDATDSRPVADVTLMVCRGGGWSTRRLDVYSAHHNGSAAASARFTLLGFRVARTLVNQP
jgi:formylglycine-generating enzyme required for sulfatase activity